MESYTPQLQLHSGVNGYCPRIDLVHTCNGQQTRQAQIVLASSTIANCQCPTTKERAIPDRNGQPGRIPRSEVGSLISASNNVISITAFTGDNLHRISSGHRTELISLERQGNWLKGREPSWVE